LILLGGLLFIGLTLFTFVQILIYMIIVLFYVKNDLFYMIVDRAFRKKTSNSKYENLRRFKNELIKLSVIYCIFVTFSFFFGLASVLFLTVLRAGTTILLMILMSYELKAIRQEEDLYTKVLKIIISLGAVGLILLTVFHTVEKMIYRF
jgi:hypothetical protein